MLLFLMRHGDALPAGGEISDDSQRPLSTTGSRQVHAVAKGLKKKSALPDLVISSPLLRAQETAQTLIERLDLDPFETSPLLAPGRLISGIAAILKQNVRRTSLLLVSHSPDVTLCVALLTGIDASHCPLFSTASVAAVQIQPLKQKASLLWFQTPEQLAQL